MRRLLLIAAAVVCMGAASDPAERLGDPSAEARARAMFREVRCLVCQNESIDASEAPLAADLRRTVREQITAGRSDGDIRAFLTQRYGEFILLKPPFNLPNALLWLGPFLLVLAGLIGFSGLIGRREVSVALTDDEERRLQSILQDEHY